MREPPAPTVLPRAHPHLARPARGDRAAGETAAGDPRLRGVRLVATWLDDAIALPGTGLRFGLDPLVGLVPGLGDLAAALAATYVLVAAWRLGAPPAILARLALNVAVDAVVGAIPILGDAFDFGWKANVRNLRLLEAWLARPREARRASALVLTGLVAAAVLVLVAVGFAIWRLAAWAAAEIAR